ncbi:cell wall hydrolase [Hephaestia sp. GCM10023244]|uniref:cell wall hydrolase n=1 Tax=Hephaestia sp. GCM10023244 TaxID=3252641 RepID=UPI0036171572
MIARLINHKHARELALACVGFLICAGVSAHGALRAIAAHPAATASISPSAPVATDAAAPAPGTTGTTTLPDLPIPLDASLGDGSVLPARAFSMAAASPIDRSRALTCLADAIYYEAASESDAGQRAVAQVVLNRVRHPAFPATVCGVVFQGSARTSGCQFSFACDGAMARTPTRAAWIKALDIASAALGGYVFAPVGLATHYHTYAVTPVWNRQLVMTDAIGAHFFHRWRGWWGTPAAFNQPYIGGEPLPGPHTRPDTPPLSTPTLAGASHAPAANASAAIPSPVKAEPAALAMVQPAYADSGALRGALAARTAQQDRLPQSPMLDRWKDTGKPLQ